jgi:hypothetical protein
VCPLPIAVFSGVLGVSDCDSLFDGHDAGRKEGRKEGRKGGRGKEQKEGGKEWEEARNININTHMIRTYIINVKTLIFAYKYIYIYIYRYIYI